VSNARLRSKRSINRAASNDAMPALMVYAATIAPNCRGSRLIYAIYTGPSGITIMKSTMCVNCTAASTSKSSHSPEVTRAFAVTPLIAELVLPDDVDNCMRTQRNRNEGSDHDTGRERSRRAEVHPTSCLNSSPSITSTSTSLAANFSNASRRRCNKSRTSLVAVSMILRTSKSTSRAVSSE